MSAQIKTCRLFLCLFLATIFLILPELVVAQATSNKVLNGRYTVWKKSLTDFSEKDDTPVCSFNDSKAAQDEANKLNQAEPGFQYVYTVVENPSAEAMALKAKDLLKNPKPGDTLKEFVNRIEDAYRNAKLAKTNLLSISGTISREKLTEANRLIDGFNRSRDEAKNYEGGLAVIRPDYPALSRIRQEDLNGKLEAGQEEAKEKALSKNDSTSGDKKYTLSVQKRENGRWRDVGDKRTFDDYSEFLAAYKAEKESVDEANKGLPGLLWTVNWATVSKPKQITMPDTGFVDVKLGNSDRQTEKKKYSNKYTGSSWAGGFEWQSDNSIYDWRNWRRNSEELILTLESDGTCYVLVGTGDHTVRRSKTTWEEKNDGFVVREVMGRKNVYVKVSQDGNLTKAMSSPSQVKSVTERFNVARGWGLQWIPQGIDSGNYYSSTYRLDECEYTSAKP